MQTQGTINVSDIINQSRLGSLQILVVVICFIIVAIDGFDTAAIGFLAPAIRAEWQLSPTALAPLFGAGLFGLMAGAFLFGPLSDKFGRKTILLFCVIFFGLTCLMSAFSTSLWELIVLRFLTGLGLGGAMPNSVTMTSEFCPAKHRLSLVTTMFCGFTLGSALGGLASAHMVGEYGWRSVLIIGGVLPLMLVPLIAWKLPESVRFLVLKGKHSERITATLKRISPEIKLDGKNYCLDHSAPSGFPVKHLFKPDLIKGTVTLWFTFFMSLLIIYLLSSWLPSLIKSTGVSLKTASLVTMMFQVGGTIGAIALGWLMDKLNPHYVLATGYIAAGAFIAAVGSLTSAPVLAGIAVFGAGFCISGAQVGVNALTASFYPTDCRGTGVSWANGVGRIGSVIGSMGGGAMIASDLTLPSVFIIIGIPALFAGCAMLFMGHQRTAIPSGKSLLA